jgi:altronate dehydratase
MSTTWSAGARLWLRRGHRRARRIIPIRTLRNISLNPNFGGEVMVVSLGCEKLQPERLLPPGSFAIGRDGDGQAALDVVCLQDERTCRLRVDDRSHPAPRRVCTWSG